jgi:hypothetical protein
MADGEVQAGPWEVAQPHEQLFVLVTGANGYVKQLPRLLPRVTNSRCCLPSQRAMGTLRDLT